MTLTLAAFIRQILSRIKIQLTDQERDTYIASCVAIAIASKLQVPSAPVQLLDTYYNTSFDKQICDILNELNEQMVIDTRLARDMTFCFYKLRYDQVHMPNVFGHIIPKLAAALPEYFPNKVSDVLAKTSQGTVEEKISVSNAWDSIIAEVANHMQAQY